MGERSFSGCLRWWGGLSGMTLASVLLKGGVPPGGCSSMAATSLVDLPVTRRITPLDGGERRTGRDRDLDSRQPPGTARGLSCSSVITRSSRYPQTLLVH